VRRDGFGAEEVAAAFVDLCDADALSPAERKTA
jgi:hypothetical protein